MEINLANPRGFCAGVDRAIDIVNRAIELLVPRFMFVMKLCTTNTSLKISAIEVQFLWRS